MGHGKIISRSGPIGHGTAFALTNNEKLFVIYDDKLTNTNSVVTGEYVAWETSKYIATSLLPITINPYVIDEDIISPIPELESSSGSEIEPDLDNNPPVDLWFCANCGQGYPFTMNNCICELGLEEVD